MPAPTDHPPSSCLDSSGRPKGRVVSILGTDVTRIEYRGEPVVTFAMVDNVHKRPEGTAGRTFRDNRKRFVRGEDFISEKLDVLRRGFPGAFPARGGGDVTLLTRRGYLKLVKPMDDDHAWAVQGEMVDRYFMVEQMTGPGEPEFAVLDADARSAISHIVVEALAEILPAMVRAQVADGRYAIGEGVTAGDVLDSAGFKNRKRPKGLALFVSHRLQAWHLEHAVPMRRGRLGTRTAILFDPLASQRWLRDGGRHAIERHLAEIGGQGVLRLVPMEPRKPDGPDDASDDDQPPGSPDTPSLH